MVSHSIIMKKFNQIHYFLLILIILCLFFRTYKLEVFYVFEHDQDLYSWIVKDILVDRHFRLIGQLTSIDGVFIGPLFYYLLVPLYAIFKMDPLSANILTLIISVFTVFSIYYVFSKMFSTKTGLIGAFIYSVSVGSAFYDRWIVPTQPTILWSVWYLFVLLSLLKGNTKTLPILGILLGLIWYIHVALAVLILPILPAIFLSKKFISLKEIIKPVFIILILTAPFWLFEIRHNYQQINGLIKSISENRGEIQGIYRLDKELQVSSTAFLNPIVTKSQTPYLIGYFSFFALFLLLIIKKQINKHTAFIIFIWIMIVLLSHFLSKRPLSEYYFSNFNILTILIYSLTVSYMYKIKNGKYLANSILLLYLLYNLIFLTNMPDGLNYYFDKKKVVDFITNDANKNKFPCIGINYITQYGRGVGFRYLFWLNGIKLVNAGKDVPVYNIVIPDKQTKAEINFGLFNIIMPEMKEFDDNNLCNDPNKQLLPMLGFTK